MDLLSETLRPFRLQTAVFWEWEFLLPWQVTVQNSHLSDFVVCYAVLEGAGYAALSGEEPVPLQAGETVLFPHQDSHVLASATAGVDGATKLACGYLTYEPLVCRTAIARLPMDVEDSVAAALSMSKGLLATVHGGYYMDRGYQSGFQLWGSDGYLRFSLHGPDARQLEWQSYKSPLVQAVTYPMGPSAYSLFVHEAMKAAATNTAPPINTAESLHLIETVVAAYRSAEQGRVQRIG